MWGATKSPDCGGLHRTCTINRHGENFGRGALSVTESEKMHDLLEKVLGFDEIHGSIYSRSMFKARVFHASSALLLLPEAPNTSVLCKQQFVMRTVCCFTLR